MSVVVRIYPEAVERLCKSTHQSVHRAVVTLGNRVRNNAVNRCPVLTGYLQSTISLEDGPDMSGWCKVVAGAEYAIYVHEGTSTQQAQPFLRDALQDEVSKLG